MMTLEGVEIKFDLLLYLASLFCGYTCNDFSVLGKC